MRWMYYHSIWMLLLFGWIILYLNRLIISPLLIPIMKEFNLNDEAELQDFMFSINSMWNEGVIPGSPHHELTMDDLGIF